MAETLVLKTCHQCGRLPNQVSETDDLGYTNVAQHQLGCLRRLITSKVRIVVAFLSLYEPILVPARFTSVHRFCPLNSGSVRSSQSMLLENVCTP